MKREVLGPELEVYEDETGGLSVHEVLAETFKEGYSIRPNLGFTKGAFWIKAQFENASHHNSFNLVISQPLLDSLEVFFLDQSGGIKKAYKLGEHVAFNNRPFEERYFILPFSLAQGETVQAMIRVATKEQVVLPIYIATESGTWSLITVADTLFGAYFGLIMVMIFYNLFVFLSTRDRSYLFYVVYIFFVGITQASIEGYTHKFFWPENFYLASRSLYLFTCLVSVSSIAFLRNFLKSDEFAPGLDRWHPLFYIYFGLIFAFALFSINPVVHVASQIGITLVAVYIYWVTITVYLRGYAPAKYFLYAWTVLVIGIIVFALKDAGILPSTPVTNYLLLFGSAIEVVLLSLALADRINILKKEKELSQASALAAAKENERIVREQNVLLEEKVAERTIDLEKSNSELSDTIHKLKEAQSQLVDSEKMASLGQLTAGVAHEINNPINFVSSNVGPLKQDFEDLLQLIKKYDSLKETTDVAAVLKQIEDFKEEIDFEYVVKEVDELIEGISEGAQRTSEIVMGLKNFSRIDEASWKFVDLNEGLKSTLLILRSNIPEDVEVSLELGEIPQVECLGGKINQVFMNIMSNALDALSIKENAGETKKLTIQSVQDEEMVFFTFRDNGIGMNENTRRRIFEPFFTTKEVGKGTGLGLSITYSIIETHRGKITVESQEGAYTLIKIGLPIKASHIK
jgi:signal transduction histidine kinase